MPPPSLAPLALDDANFVALRAAGQIYVDKTAYIQRMLEARIRYAFLARPRRFGKSLLVSTLRALYARQNDDLFQGLAIQTSGFLSQVAPRPTLTLDFSNFALNRPESIEDRLREAVGEQCAVLNLPAPAPDISPGAALFAAAARLGQAHGQPVVVLIDEYDALITHMLSKEPPFSAEGQAYVMDHLRAFYATLKKLGQQNLLAFTFITGITRVEGAGLFSALNNLIDLSREPEYAAICGFTEAETQIFEAHLAAIARAHPPLSATELRRDLRHYYNGYQFTTRAEQVYNPVSYARALHQWQTPEHVQDRRDGRYPRPWIEAGLPYFLFRYMRQRGLGLKDIQNNASAESLRDKFDLHNPGLTSLLFQTGFLTLKSGTDGELIVDYPNREVAEAFHTGLFLTYLGRPMEDQAHIQDLFRSMQTALLEGKYRQACACFDRMLDNVPFKLLPDERAYQGLLHMACLSLPAFLGVESEALTRYGQADTVIEMANKVVVFELKLNGTAAGALAQLEKKRYGAKYRDRNVPVIGVGLNFDAPKGHEPEARRAAPYGWEMKCCALYSPLKERTVTDRGQKRLFGATNTSWVSVI